MNIAKMKKNELISELQKRNMSTEGLKDDLKNRLLNALEDEKSEPESNDGDNTITSKSPKSIDSESVSENSKQIPDPATELTVEDTLNMKKIVNTTESISMIVNATDDGSEYTTDNQPTSDVKDKFKVDLDNGDDEILELNDVSIDLNYEERRDNNDEKEDYNDDLQTNSNLDKLDNDCKDGLKDKTNKEESQPERTNNDKENTEIKVAVNEDSDKKAVDEIDVKETKRVHSAASSSDSWGPSKKWKGSVSPQNSPKKKKSVSRSRSVSKDSPKKGAWGDSDDEKNICVPKQYSPRKSKSPNDFPKRDYGSRPRRADFRGGRGRRNDFRGGRGGGFRDRFRNDDDRPPRAFAGSSRDYHGRDRSRERFGDRRDDRRDRDYARRDDYKRPERYDDRHGGSRTSGLRSRDFDEGRSTRDYKHVDRDRGRFEDSRRPQAYDRDSHRDMGFRSHQSTSRRDYGPPKRPLKYEEEYPPPNFHKRRRDDDGLDASRRERFRASPKKHAYNQGGYDREYRKPDYRPRDNDDHSTRPTRKHGDYTESRRRNYDDVPVAPSERRPRKDRDFGSNGAAPLEFGGRSRHYD